MTKNIISKTEHINNGGTGVIIVAGGKSRRMGSQDKLFVPVLGKPIITYSIQAFHDTPLVSQIILVTTKNNKSQIQRLSDENGWHKVTDVCIGGPRRQDSVRNGLECMPNTTWTIIHDGARPVVSSRMIEDGLRAAHETGAATAGIPLSNTIKRAGPDLHVLETLDRRALWIIQTPQVFRTEMIRKAHQQNDSDVTDDATLIEKIGGVVKIFEGDPDNIKITLPSDITVATAILKRKASMLSQ
jgi:2-C-methyl-D-erythritol 4-phosphate cytidylyltransferase